MKFDSLKAWHHVSALIRSNRDVLSALAGVFILLPSLAVSLFVPPLAAPAGTNPEQMMELTRAYYLSALPFMIPVFLLQAVATLAMLVLFTDSSRPSVKDALNAGGRAMIPYIVTQLIVGLSLGIAGTIVLALVSLTGLRSLAVFTLGALMAVSLYVLVRTSVAAPVITVERQYNPVKILRRSWQLTDGQVGRIALFYLLIAIVYFVVMVIATMAVGAVLSLLSSAETIRVGSAVVTSIFSAVIGVFVAAILAAVYRQLAHPQSD